MINPSRRNPKKVNKKYYRKIKDMDRERINKMKSLMLIEKKNHTYDKQIQLALDLAEYEYLKKAIEIFKSGYLKP